MYAPAYVRPVAYHRDFSHRLVLKDEADRWYLWQGDGSDPMEIERSLAEWMYHRAEVYPMAGPAMWFDIASLPVSADANSYTGN